MNPKLHVRSRRRRLAALPVLLTLMLIAPAMASAQLEATPASVDFGVVDRYDNNGLPASSVSVKNIGLDMLEVTNVMIDGSGYWISMNGCSGVFLGSSEGCQIDVSVSPAQFGANDAVLEVSSSLQNLEVPLSATASPGSLQVNPSQLDFWPQPWYWGQQQQTVNLNADLRSLDIGNIEITGPDANLFSFQWEDCSNRTLYAYNNCGIGLNFNPSGPQASTDAVLQVHSNASNGPTSFIPLKATALVGPVLEFSPESLDFGEVEVGTSSSPETFSVKNVGDFPMQIQQILLVSGASSMFRAEDDQCTFQVVAPTETCTFDLRFSPTRAGDKDGSIFVLADTPSGVQTIGISGQAVSAPSVAAVLSGEARVGKDLTCTATNAVGSLAFEWLRDGDRIAGADSARYRLTESDLGALVACRITASNGIGSKVATSAKTEPVLARDLAFQSDGRLSANQCRVVRMPELDGIKVKTTEPVSTLSPLVLRASDEVSAELGDVARTGKKIVFTPRDLRPLPDGSVPVRVDGSKSGDAVLAGCNLLTEMFGSPRSGATLSVYSSEALRKAIVRVPRLRFKPSRGISGHVTIVSGANADQTVLPITGKKWKRDGIKFKLSKRGVVVSGLPGQTGSVSIELGPRTVRGKARAPKLSIDAVLSEGGKLSATGKALWRR